MKQSWTRGPNEGWHGSRPLLLGRADTWLLEPSAFNLPNHHPCGRPPAYVPHETAVVTGSARGIGCAIVERLARDGFAIRELDWDGNDNTVALVPLRETGLDVEAGHSTSAIAAPWTTPSTRSVAVDVS